MIRVLHVDDESDVHVLTTYNLKKTISEIELEPALSALEALSMLAEDDNYDCIISDYQMPGMNGKELLKTLNDEGYQIPFIFLTGQGSEEFAAEVLRSGADDYYSKNANFAQYELLAKGILNVVTVYKERSGKLKATAGLKSSEEKFSKMFNAYPQTMIVSRMSDGKVVDVNDGFVLQSGFSREEVIGRTTQELGIVKDENYRKKITAYLSDTGQFSRKLFNFFDKNGKELHMEISVAIFEHDGERFLVTYADDNSEHINLKAKLDLIQQRLAEVHNISQIGFWEFDPISGETYISPKMQELFEMKMDKSQANLADIMANIHPDDQERSNKAFEQAIANKSDFILSHRLLMPDGRIKYIDGRGKTFFDDSGNLLKVMGTAYEVSDSIRTHCQEMKN
jgi:PAS domain S-box-containing protein